jgi:uncharacterized damage-inducible protein DinB
VATERSPQGLFMTSQELLQHWQGHRALTRRVIEAFPEEALFQFSIGGMRPFAAMALEMIGMAAGGINGVASRKWRPAADLDHHSGAVSPKTRDELLRLWDRVTDEINTLWPRIPPQRFREIDKAFGQWEGPITGLLLYWIDNEIHHRGQGYVYLRSLGIDPPPCYER